MISFESFLLSYVLNSLWQLPLLFCAVWLAARALRPLGATAEHRAWVSALMLQAVLPACCMLPWRWLSTFVSWLSTSAQPQDGQVRVVMGSAKAFGPLYLRAQVLGAVLLTYAVVTAYFIARFLWRARRLALLRSDAEPLVLTGEAALCWERSSKRFGVPSASIASSSRVFGPVTLGIHRKLVLVPAGMASNLPAADLHTFIAHEFAHMYRSDFLKNLFYEFISLPIHYHPILWLTREHIIKTREMICDELASEPAGKHEYARSLLRLAALLRQGAPARTPHAIGIFDANVLERRLMKLTEKDCPLSGPRCSAIAIACVIVGLAASGTALILGSHLTPALAASA